MIVGGGIYDGTTVILTRGGNTNPSTDSWVATSITNAPSPRRLHTGSGLQRKMSGGSFLMAYYVLILGAIQSLPDTESQHNRSASAEPGSSI